MNIIDPNISIFVSEIGLKEKDIENISKNIFFDKKYMMFFNDTNLLYYLFLNQILKNSFFCIDPLGFDKKNFYNFIKKVKNNGFNIFVTEKTKNIIEFYDDVIENNKIEFIKKTEKENNIFDYLLKYKGITVVGDIHSNSDSLKKAIDWAFSNNHLLIFLGDIFDINYFNDKNPSISIINKIYNLVIDNKAFLCLGNHDMKFYKKFLFEKHMYLIDHVLYGKNIDIIEFVKTNFIFRKSKSYIKINNFIFCHASWVGDDTDNFFENKRKDYLRISGKYVKNKNTLLYEDDLSWIDKIFFDENKENMNIFVGHKILSNKYPKILFDEKHGNKIYFIDTGCNKGGVLSSVDIVFQENNLKIRNFNVYE